MELNPDKFTSHIPVCDLTLENTALSSNLSGMSNSEQIEQSETSDILVSRTKRSSDLILSHIEELTQAINNWIDGLLPPQLHIIYNKLGELQSALKKSEQLTIYKEHELKKLPESNIDLLSKSRWWVLAYNQGFIEIKDDNLNKVKIRRMQKDHTTFEWILSLDEKTIATIVCGVVEIWFIDLADWINTITWTQESDSIDKQMYKYANMLLSQPEKLEKMKWYDGKLWDWHKWKLKNLWGWIYSLNYHLNKYIFLDNDWFVLRSEKGTASFGKHWWMNIETAKNKLGLD